MPSTGLRPRRPPRLPPRHRQSPSPGSCVRLSRRRSAMSPLLSARERTRMSFLRATRRLLPHSPIAIHALPPFACPWTPPLLHRNPGLTIETASEIPQNVVLLTLSPTNPLPVRALPSAPTAINIVLASSASSPALPQNAKRVQTPQIHISYQIRVVHPVCPSPPFQFSCPCPVYGQFPFFKSFPAPR